MVKIVYKDNIWDLEEEEWESFVKTRTVYFQAIMSGNVDWQTRIESDMQEYLDDLIQNKDSAGRVEQVINFN